MGNVVPDPLQRLRAADIIRMAGLTTASLGQEHCRTGAVHSTQRQGTSISGIVDVQAASTSQRGEVKADSADSLEAEQHRYPVAIDLKSATSWTSSCPCTSQVKTLCRHTAALLYQWLEHPTAFIVVLSAPAVASAALHERKGTEVVDKDTVHTEPNAVATKTSFSQAGSGTTGKRISLIQRSQPGPTPLGDLQGSLIQLGLSDLRSMGREYEIATNGMGKQQLADAIIEKLKQPEAVRRVAATLEKRQRQLLAALALAGGSITDDDLRGLFQRFSLGQPSQLHGTLIALQRKAFLFRASLNSSAKSGRVSELSGSLLNIGWYVPQEICTALRISMPVTPFNEVADNQQESASILKLSKPYDLLADLLLVAHALDGYHLEEASETPEADGTASHSSNVHSTDGSVSLSPPADIPSAALLSALQKIVERSPKFLRFAVRLLQLAGILHKDKDDQEKPLLRILPDAAQLLLGPTRATALHDLFELWLVQSSYSELFELQEDNLRLRCRANSLNQPFVRASELDAENSEARQTIIALLAQAPLQQWISFSAFVRFIYRLNPFFLQRRSRLFTTPHWWIEQDEGRPLRPAHLNDWQQAEAHYLEHFLCGPLHWWGICDLTIAKDGNLLAFRLTALADQLLNGSEPSAQEEDYHPLADTLKIVDAKELLVTCTTQAWKIIELLEVFAESAGVHNDCLCYHLTPKAIASALSHGHRPAALLELLRNAATNSSTSEDSLAQMLAQLEQWIAGYGHIRIYTGVSLLETTDPVVTRELSATTVLDDQIVKPIHPTLFVLKQGAAARLIEDLKRRGQFPLLHEEDSY